MYEYDHFKKKAYSIILLSMACVGGLCGCAITIALTIKCILKLF